MEKIDLKKEATIILGVSFGFICASLLIAIGINMIIENHWVGALITILGYEIARKTIIISIKHASQTL